MDQGLSSRWATALVMGAGAILLVTIGYCRSVSRSEPDWRLRLLESVSPARPVEGRLASMGYAPIKSCPSVREYRLALERPLHDRSSVQALWAAALVDLLEDCGHGRGVDVAVGRLERASRMLPASAELWSDLSAAYLARANAERPLDFALALAAAVRALRLNPRLPEARFNHALALEANLLRSAAQGAWQNDLAGFGAHGWKTEAAEHRRRLSAPRRAELWQDQHLLLETAIQQGDIPAVRRIVQVFPWRARSFAEDDLLQNWAVAVTRGQSGLAADRLRDLRVLGRVLAEEGQPMTAEVVGGFDSAPPSLLRPLAWSVLGQAEGARLCLANQGVQGERLLAETRSTLERAHSPLAEWTAYHLGVCAYQRFDFVTAAAREKTLLSKPGTRRYPALAGRANWMLGLASMGLGEPQRASLAYEESLRILEGARFEAKVGGILLLLAENRLYLGDRQEAWRLVRRGFEIAATEGDERQLFTALDKTADFALRESLPEVSLAFRQELIRLILKGDPDPPALAHALLRRAETRFALGQQAAALQDLAEAERAAQGITDESERGRRRMDILIAAGKFLLAEKPRQAIDRLTQALEIAESRSFRYPITDILLTRARAALRLGQNHPAETDLLHGIAEFERQRSEVRSEDLRITYFAQARELFEQLIGLQAGRPDGAQLAFATAERQRARVLLDRLAPGKTASGNLEEIRRRLPLHTVLIAYSVLPERLLIWVVRPDGLFQQREIRIRREQIDREVSRLLARLHGASVSELERDLGSLHGLLLAPVLTAVQPGDCLIFIPDGSLHGIPFAALRDPQTGRFLVEDHASAVYPSASSLATPRSTELNGSLLAVVNPGFDRALYPGFASLPGADAEATLLQARYPDRVRVLTGPKATRSAFLRDQEDAEVLHLAMHAWAPPDLPHQARLLLAPSPGDPGELSTAEILQLDLRHIRLVFLAGCRTGGGPVGPEGVLSLARSFLADGVPEVVFSLWNLSDRATSELSMAFYSHRLRGEDAPEALRQAQLSVLRRAKRDPTSVYIWGTLQVSAVGKPSATPDGPGGQFKAGG